MVVSTWRLDRLKADGAILKHLRFAGIGIVTLAKGEGREHHVGLKGAVNTLFLKDLAAKTHRGLQGCVENGKSGDDLCYGYDVVEAPVSTNSAGPALPKRS